MRQEIVDRRRPESWFGPASAAWDRIAAGHDDEADWAAIAPFSYGRWDAAAQAVQAADEEQVNREAAGHFYADGAFDPAEVRAALATFGAPVLLLAGELDIVTCPKLAEQVAALFPAAELVVQPGAGTCRGSTTRPGWPARSPRSWTGRARPDEPGLTSPA